MIGAGIQTIKDSSCVQAAGICVFTAMVTNIVLAWDLAMFLENNGLIRNKERAKKLSILDKWVIPLSILKICIIAMLVVGMLEGSYGIIAFL